MTPYQKNLMKAAKRGARFYRHIGGIYYRNRLLRVETSDALLATGEFVLIVVQGKRLRSDIIVHESCVDKMAESIKSTGREVLEITKDFRY